MANESAEHFVDSFKKFIQGLPLFRPKILETNSQFQLRVELAEGAFGDMEKLNKFPLCLPCRAFSNVAWNADPARLI